MNNIDESRRLKGMPSNYDEALFNSLYKELLPLRNKLVYQIDARKFGVDSEEIKSWFDIKFIHVFRKYHSNPRLKGYLINSLRMYKTHIVKASYHAQMDLYTQSRSWDDLGEQFHESIPDEQYEPKPELDLALEYLKQKLSPNAFFILELELTPPTFFEDRKFNAENILVFLNMPITEDNMAFIKNLKSEIKQAIKNAKNHFTQPR